MAAFCNEIIFVVVFFLPLWHRKGRRQGRKEDEGRLFQEAFVYWRHFPDLPWLFLPFFDWHFECDHTETHVRAMHKSINFFFLIESFFPNLSSFIDLDAFISLVFCACVWKKIFNRRAHSSVKSVCVCVWVCVGWLSVPRPFDHRFFILSGQVDVSCVIGSLKIFCIEETCVCVCVDAGGEVVVPLGLNWFHFRLHKSFWMHATNRRRLVGTLVSLSFYSGVNGTFFLLPHHRRTAGLCSSHSSSSALTVKETRSSVASSAPLRLKARPLPVGLLAMRLWWLNFFLFLSW